MAGKKLGNLIGSWAFLVGVVLALAIGIASAVDESILLNYDSGMAITLIVIGLIVGLFNITSKEVTPFLLSGICLIIASAFGAGMTASIPGVGATLSSILLIFVPATIIVAVKNVFSLAKN